MRRVFFILTLFLVFHQGSFAQNSTVQGVIEYVGEGWIYLASYYGDSFTIIDSTRSGSGSFYFFIGEEHPPGIFRIIYPEEYNGIRTENRYFEFIGNGEDFEVVVVPGTEGPSVYFENSLENQVYQEFMAYEVNYEARMTVLYRAMALERKAPASGDDLETPGSGMDPNAQAGEIPGTPTQDTYEKLQTARDRFLDSLLTIYPQLYASRILQAFRSPFLPGRLTHRERVDTLRSSFFDHASIDDPGLLYAPIYTFKLIDFLSLYKEDSVSGPEQEMLFITAIDRLMVNVSHDPDLRAFVTGYLLQGFEMLGMEEVQVHVADHYLDESCESDIVELILARMEGYRNMKVGLEAPDFVIRDRTGKSHRLSELGNPYILVMFWASTCEHCQEMLPELHDWYTGERTMDLEIVAISIDTAVSHFEIFTDMLEPLWITSHDPLGWHGKVPSAYHIYATPALFLLDRERIILARPTSFRQFTRALKRLEL